MWLRGAHRQQVSLFVTCLPTGMSPPERSGARAFPIGSGGGYQSSLPCRGLLQTGDRKSEGRVRKTVDASALCHCINGATRESSDWTTPYAVNKYLTRSINTLGDPAYNTHRTYVDLPHVECRCKPKPVAATNSDYLRIGVSPNKLKLLK